MNLNEFIKTEQDAKNCLIGTIFADGSLGKQRTDGSKNGTNVDLEITHTSKNLDYLQLIKQILEKIDGIKCSISQHNKITENKIYSLYRLRTNRHKWLTDLRNKIYENRIKKFPYNIYKDISDLGLFFMYLDDGTLRVRCYEGTSRIRECRITFCLDSFTIDELNQFRVFLKQKYDIDTKVYRHSKNLSLDRGFRIWTNTFNTKKFMEIFDKFYDLVPSMQYKFIKYYSL